MTCKHAHPGCGMGHALVRLAAAHSMVAGMTVLSYMYIHTTMIVSG